LSLELAHERLGWPSRLEILKPSGEGARMFAGLAQSKIGDAVAHQPGGGLASTGILSPDSTNSGTEAPVAIVCEFPASIPHVTLRELQRLAWSFSRCPMLVTLEPEVLRAWTCCEAPSGGLPMEHVVHEIPISDLRSSVSKRAVQALHWVNLISGEFFRNNATRFRRNQRADQMLLENLTFARERLRETGLRNDDVCHDLIARVIFIQFLFDRKDSSGNAALHEGVLDRLHHAGVLRMRHSTLASILSDYQDSYRLFDWLNERFNGDLFPSKANDSPERERAWEAERRLVKQGHLEVLRDLVSGDLQMPTGQRCLWREYAFDAIPLEFISSIYEAFVSDARKSGIYYTPPHLVDFMLDRVLPWGGDLWDLKVIDPACGSGVFLVKAFQRLVHRWKSCHPNQTIRAETLRGLLENNLFGVDKDPHAVRVASFSLYLAMCDEIDPKHYWTQVHFPSMQGRRLMRADFFREDRVGFSSRNDAGTYDIVVGNAPWGEELLTKEAKEWARDKDHKWPLANKGIGTLFLPKAAILAKPDGKVAMIQSASSLLFNRSGPAREFRNQFFTTFCVKELINLSALRFKIFKKKKGSAKRTVSPACVVVFGPKPPNGNRLLYLSPKAMDDEMEGSNFIIEPPDVKEISQDEASRIPEIWTCLLWGNPRDWRLIRRLCQLESIERRISPDNYRWGIEFGDRKKPMPDLRGRHILMADDFPDNDLVHLDAERSPTLEDPYIHSKDSTEFRAFSLPQLLVKMSWLRGKKRFQARLVQSKDRKGVLCKQSYVTVHVPKHQTGFLTAACASYNSIFAVYFLLLTSGRFASYRPSPLVEELLRVPVPELRSGQLSFIRTPQEFDDEVRNAFSFKDAEWVLIEDMVNITLGGFMGGHLPSPGHARTKRTDGVAPESQLQAYCEYFMRVLNAGFGKDREIVATIFEEKGLDLLPFRLVAFQLDHGGRSSVSVERLEPGDLLDELERLNKAWLKNREGRGQNIYHERVARIYDYTGHVPTVFILKPDGCRYWTRSMGLHDGDEVAADFVRWQRAASEAGGDTRAR
jgi:hypothetical protein